jgi:hypothetical protein
MSAPTTARKVLSKAVDATGMDTLEMELYFSDLDIMKIDFGEATFEMSSSGAPDGAEKYIFFADLFKAIKNPKVGWNHVAVPLSQMKNADVAQKGEFNIANIDHIGIYWTKCETDKIGMTFKIDNIRLTSGAAQLEKAGVELISPQFANTNVDLPALPAEAYRLVQDKSRFAIMDIGGDDRGAYALGRYVPSILEENNYRMIFVANCYRPLTRTPEEAMEVMAEIEEACKLKFTDIINNSNLGTETTPETVLASQAYMEKLSQLSGLPIFATSAEANVAAALDGQIPDVLPLRLQEKYFDLPSQKPGNRPLWG